MAAGSGRFVSGLPARGEVWWCELAEIGRRPVVVLSRDAAIPRVRGALVVNLDCLKSVSMAVLASRLRPLADVPMRKICRA